MQRCHPTDRHAGRGPRHNAVSPVGLAAVVAVLHVAVFAGRVPLRPMDHRQRTLLAWHVPAGGQIAPVCSTAGRAPSKPTQAFCVGRLSLTIGMAVVALAAWLHIMRVNGAYGP